MSWPMTNMAMRVRWISRQIRSSGLCRSCVEKKSLRTLICPSAHPMHPNSTCCTPSRRRLWATLISTRTRIRRRLPRSIKIPTAIPTSSLRITVWADLGLWKLWTPKVKSYHRAYTKGAQQWYQLLSTLPSHILHQSTQKQLAARQVMKKIRIRN